MLTIETNSQTTSVPNSLTSNSAGSSQNPQDPAQTGNNAVDWQEEVYQKIKSMKEMYLPDLSDLHQKICQKCQQEPKSEHIDRLKMFRSFLDSKMKFSSLSKSNIAPSHKDKLVFYEKQILSMVNSNRHFDINS